jgi:molybdenum cofactor cytidylyltransferase
MRARRLTPSDLIALPPHELDGAVLLAHVTLAGVTLRKGTRLDPAAAASLREAARQGALSAPVRLAWLDDGDLHEDDAAGQLARAVAGPGVLIEAPRQSRLDLVARWDGVVHVRVGELTRLNALDPLEVFTLYHGQSVVAGETVASVKVAPHVVESAVVQAGEAVARGAAPLVDVHPFLALEVGAIAEEALTPAALERFEAGVRLKVEALGSRFAGSTVIGSPDPAAAEHDARAALVRLVRERRLRVVLVGGVSAGDPLSSFFAALEGLGGRLLRRGVPAHPGSMIWLAELDGSRLLGLPQCGMFSMATAADLVLPRLLTGETLTGADLADLAHGGVLGREMRFRFPAYARALQVPEG